MMKDIDEYIKAIQNKDASASGLTDEQVWLQFALVALADNSVQLPYEAADNALEAFKKRFRGE